MAAWQAKHGNIELEQRRGARALKTVNLVDREPQVADIINFLRDGYLVKCLINSKALNGKSGYTGHAVVVKGYEDGELILHDPGLPPRPNRRVRPVDFEKAWASPNAKAKDLVAVRREGYDGLEK